MSSFTPRYAITFGEVAILHVGGAELGTMRSEGFSVAELDFVAKQLVAAGKEAELLLVSDALPEPLRAANEAAVLVIRDGANVFGASADAMLAEQEGLQYDRKFYHTRQRKTMHKRARYNTVFGDEHESASECFKQPTVHAFPPHLRAFRAGLAAVLGPKAVDLKAEGNHYFEPSSGIGFHGDSERKIVACLSLGSASCLRYHWRLPGSSEHTLRGVDVVVRHGDVYVMSEKATGFDWMRRSLVRVVHAAGSAKYIGHEGERRAKRQKLE